MCESTSLPPMGEKLREAEMKIICFELIIKYTKFSLRI